QQRKRGCDRPFRTRRIRTLCGRRPRPSHKSPTSTGWHVRFQAEPMTKFDWEFFNGFSGWASGLATLLAVVVSLWLATRDNRVKLKVRAGLVWRVTQDSDQKQSFISFQVTNIGYGPAYIVGLFWKLGLFRRQIFFTVPTSNPCTDTIPHALKE